jgi:hypothetical protein
MKVSGKDRRVGGPQRRSGRGCEEKKKPCPCRKLDPDHPARSVITIL